MKFKTQENLCGYLFIAVPLAILLVFSFFPMACTLFISFHKWPMLGFERPFIGLENFYRLFKDDVFWIALKNTFLYTIIVVPSQTFLALFLAVLANKGIRGQTFFKTSYYVPAVVSSVAISLVFIWFYRGDGFINYLLSFFAIDGPNWLNDPTFALPAIILMNIWTTSGYFMIAYLAGLQSIPAQLYEAAKIDGASAWSRFWRITCPLLRPTTLFIVILSVIGCLQVFDQVYVMTSGGPYPYATTTINYLIWQKFSFGRLGYTAAIAWVLFVIILVVTLIQKKFIKGEAEY